MLGRCKGLENDREGLNEQLEEVKRDNLRLKNVVENSKEEELSVTLEKLRNQLRGAEY